MASPTPRFDPAGYPGRRPAGPCLVVDGVVHVLEVTRVGPSALGTTTVVPERLHWSLAYGSNASPDRLVDKGVDREGAVLLPATLTGWAAAWEARRAPVTGAVPLTLVPRVGATLEAWLLGVGPEAAVALDRSEGRGHRYVMGAVGPVDVAGLVTVDRVGVYGPGVGTRLLLDGDEVATWPRRDQAWARRREAEGGPTAAAPPLPDQVPHGFPATFTLRVQGAGPRR